MNRKEKLRGMLPVLRDRQASMDETIASMKDGRPTTCDTCTSPGCCYQKVTTQLAEAVLIAYHLKTAKLDTSELRRLLFETGKKMEATPRPEWFSNMVPCVFLTEDRRCAIYKARPVQCRTYYVISEEANCQPPESMPVKQVDLRQMLLDELAHLTAMHTFWGLKETPDKMYMRSLPMAVFIALKFLEEPTKEVLDKHPWPSADNIGHEPVKKS